MADNMLLYQEPQKYDNGNLIVMKYNKCSELISSRAGRLRE